MGTKNKFLLRGDIALVEWLDACSEDAWSDADEIDLDPEHITSCGIIFEHNKKKITLALNHDPANDSFSCLITIPSGMLLSVRKLID